MNLIVEERWESRDEEVAVNDGNATRTYAIWDGDGTYINGLAARAALYASPNYSEEYHGLQKQTISFKLNPPAIWFATVRYAKVNNFIAFRLDTTCEKSKKAKSLETIANYNVLNIAEEGFEGTDYGGLVNVSKDRVEGHDVYTPGFFKFELQWSAKNADINAGYQALVIAMSGTVNNSQVVFNSRGQEHVFERGELLLIGGLFDQQNDNATITLKFEGQKNLPVRNVGEIDGTAGNAYLTTADTTLDAATITLASTDGLIPFLRVTGDGIPPGTLVSTVLSDTEVILSNAATATASGAAVAFYIDEIQKEGWWYVWVHTVKKRDATLRIDVEQPDSVHVERDFEYSDFTDLQVFDSISGWDDEFTELLEQEEEEE